MERFLQEKEEFIKSQKLKTDLSLAVKDDYYYGVKKAFDDAFKQYARREKKKYTAEKQDLIKPIAETLFRYFNSAGDNFDACFEACIALSKEILNNNLYGIAQKLVNMSFKYLYCYSDAVDYESKFKDCHMPLDKHTIKWVRSLKNEDIKQRLDKINSAWSNIDEELYNDIQKLITDTLNKNAEYKISCNENSAVKTCPLPQNKLFAEFFIWHQERINELYNIIKKAESDFDRLGIRWAE